MYVIGLNRRSAWSSTSDAAAGAATTTDTVNPRRGTSQRGAIVAYQAVPSWLLPSSGRRSPPAPAHTRMVAPRAGRDQTEKRSSDGHTYPGWSRDKWEGVVSWSRSEGPLWRRGSGGPGCSWSAANEDQGRRCQPRTPCPSPRVVCSVCEVHDPIRTRSRPRSCTGSWSCRATRTDHLGTVIALNQAALVGVVRVHDSDVVGVSALSMSKCRPVSPSRTICVPSGDRSPFHPVHAMPSDAGPAILSRLTPVVRLPSSQPAHTHFRVAGGLALTVAG